jgi:hypothetical protein
MRTLAAIAFTAGLAAAPASAQQPPPPASTRGIEVGPVTITPHFEIREVGIDDNVFNDPVDPQRDFTATMTSRVNARVRMGWTRLTGSSTVDAVYFKKFTEERALNRAAEGRFEIGEGLLRPFLTAGIIDTNERMNAEIDARAGRRQTNYGGGVGVAFTPRTILLLSARRSNLDFDDDEQYRGVNLSRTLNSHSDQFDAGIRMAITPLTTWDITGGVQYDRFGRDPRRNADSLRVTTGLEFNPSALLSGRASVGYRRFTPAVSSLAAYNGIVAQAGLTYSVESTRVEGQLERDVRYSFEDLEPYYVTTGGRIVITRQLAGPVDTQGIIGRQSLDYREFGADSAPGAPRISSEVSRRDRASVYGVGLGYRLGHTARFGFNVEWSRRRSDELADRRYNRRRLYGTVTYGF